MVAITALLCEKIPKVLKQEMLQNAGMLQFFLKEFSTRVGTIVRRSIKTY